VPADDSLAESSFAGWGEDVSDAEEGEGFNRGASDEWIEQEHLPWIWTSTL